MKEKLLTLEEWRQKLGFQEPEHIFGNFYGYPDILERQFQRIQKALESFRDKDPDELKNAPNPALAMFYLPFGQFENGEVTMQDAVIQRWWLTIDLAIAMYEEFFERVCAYFFEFETGQRLSDVMDRLTRRDREAAILLVGVFKYVRNKNPIIKRMIKNATRDKARPENRDFLDRIDEAFKTVKRDEKGNSILHPSIRKPEWFKFMWRHKPTFEDRPDLVLEAARAEQIPGFTDSEWQQITEAEQERRLRNLKQYIKRHEVRVKRGRTKGTTKRVSCLKCGKLFTPERVPILPGEDIESLIDLKYGAEASVEYTDTHICQRCKNQGSSKSEYSPKYRQQEWGKSQRRLYDDEAKSPGQVVSPLGPLKDDLTSEPLRKLKSIEKRLQNLRKKYFQDYLFKDRPTLRDLQKSS